ncbi:pentapeptide repeat-containing protein, partial [Anaerotruncus colihominis]
MNILDILDKHAAWLRGEPEGVKADLPGANLSKANLSGANLSKANLS